MIDRKEALRELYQRIKNWSLALKAFDRDELMFETMGDLNRAGRLQRDVEMEIESLVSQMSAILDKGWSDSVDKLEVIMEIIEGE